MWVLGIEPGSSRRSDSDFNHWITSPSPWEWEVLFLFLLLHESLYTAFSSNANDQPWLNSPVVILFYPLHILLAWISNIVFRVLQLHPRRMLVCIFLSLSLTKISYQVVFMCIASGSLEHTMNPPASASRGPHKHVAMPGSPLTRLCYGGCANLTQQLAKCFLPFSLGFSEVLSLFFLPPLVELMGLESEGACC
jgi:hypothetical protein